MSANSESDVTLRRRPEARGFRVEDLLEAAETGRLRIPEFQRPLRWKSKNVIDLFDSINRGFPIGDLLLSRDRADAGMVVFGSVSFQVEHQHAALWVVDGQQRLTALIASLLRSDSVPRRDYWAVWYDLENQSFKSLNRREPPSDWIPMNALSDSVRQLKWIRAWPYAEEREDLVDRILELGKSIREYEVPAYIVEGADDTVLRLIFTRVNSSGAAMQESEIFEALYGHEGEQPIRAAIARLTDLGFGHLDGDLFLRCLKAVCTSMRPDDQIPDDLPADSIQRTEKALRRAIKTLTTVAGIPRFQLMPYRLPLYILSAFYDRFPEENYHADAMAARWVWRGAFSEAHTDSSDAKVASLVRTIRSGENAEVTMAELIKITGQIDIDGCQEWMEGMLEQPISLVSAAGKMFILMLCASNPARRSQGVDDPDPELFPPDIEESNSEHPDDVSDSYADDSLDLHPSSVYQSIYGPGGEKLGVDIILRLKGMKPSGDISGEELNLETFLLNDQCLTNLRENGVDAFRQCRRPLLAYFIQRFVGDRVGDGSDIRPSIPAILTAKTASEVAS